MNDKYAMGLPGCDESMRELCPKDCGYEPCGNYIAYPSNPNGGTYRIPDVEVYTSMEVKAKLDAFEERTERLEKAAKTRELIEVFIYLILFAGCLLLYLWVSRYIF